MAHSRDSQGLMHKGFAGGNNIRAGEEAHGRCSVGF